MVFLIEKEKICNVNRINIHYVEHLPKANTKLVVQKFIYILYLNF